jgi:hypothetical protein
MIVFSTAIPGVYALEDNGSMEMPQMDAAQMKEMTLGMIENNIDALTTLQSETEDEDTLQSIESLLEQMESQKTELEGTDDKDTVEDIMGELRTLMEEAPEQVRESLMQNGPGGYRGLDGEGMMNGNGTCRHLKEQQAVDSREMEVWVELRWEDRTKEQLTAIPAVQKLSQILLKRVQDFSAVLST